MRSILYVALAATLAALIIVLALPAPAAASCESMDSCFTSKKVDSVDCDPPRGLRVAYENRCSDPVDAQICAERSDGTWKCDTRRLQPGVAGTLESCKGTGRYSTQAKRADQTLRCALTPPSPTEQRPGSARAPAPVP